MQDLEKMDLGAAKAEVANAVYAATGIFEDLEALGKVRGNGHHMRQHISTAAEDLMAERWVGSEPEPPPDLSISQPSQSDMDEVPILAIALFLCGCVAEVLGGMCIYQGRHHYADIIIGLGCCAIGFKLFYTLFSTLFSKSKG